MKNLLSKGLYQEDLKIIACVCMLLDHIGVVFFPAADILRIIGRTAFPLYCFLLTEGFFHTASKPRYALRLALAALISEIPYDLANFNQIVWIRSSVMVTLLLGFSVLWLAEQVRCSARGVAAVGLIIACVRIADWVHSDYGSRGVLMVLLFAATAELPHRNLWRFPAVGLMCFWIHGYMVDLPGLRVPIELFGLLSMPLIACYNGQKRSRSAAVSRIFYGFYPGHLLVLYLLKQLMGGAL